MVFIGFPVTSLGKFLPEDAQMVANEDKSVAITLPKSVFQEGKDAEARGDFRPDSDWDLLILLNKDKEEYSDFDNYSYPFISLGFDYGVPVSAHLYTMSKWNEMAFSPFYHNVEHDKIVLI